MFNEKVKKVCTRCGSLNVAIDVSARWNIKTQNYAVETNSSDGYCNDCGLVCDIEEMLLSEPTKIYRLIRHLNVTKKAEIEKYGTINEVREHYCAWLEEFIENQKINKDDANFCRSHADEFFKEPISRPKQPYGDFWLEHVYTFDRKL